MDIGPLQLLVIGFADPKLDGSVLGSLVDASDAGFIRIVDLLYGAEMGALVGAMAAVDEFEYGVDADGIRTIADDIPAGGAAMILVLEHRWAIPFRDAARASGGILLAQDFLNPEALIAFGAEIALEG